MEDDPLQEKIKRRLPLTVPETLSSFHTIGMSTPAAIERKFSLLNSVGVNGAVGIVVVDAFRCSSTLLACFAAGLHGAVIMEKSLQDRGVSTEMAQRLSADLGRRLVFGGELYAKPIPGAVIGNSPRDAINNNQLDGALLHFQSTNLGRAFVDVVLNTSSWLPRPDIYLVSFANAEATAQRIRARTYQKLLLVCAGFYGCIAFEDMMVQGSLIHALKTPLPLLDDEARSMYACSQLFAGNEDAYPSCWTGRVLTRLHLEADMTDIVSKGKLPASALMQRLVLTVQWSSDLPVIKAEAVEGDFGG